MNISVESILSKIEIELTKARKVEDESQLKSHLYAIKALAEIVIDDGKEIGQAAVKPAPVLRQTHEVRPLDSPSKPITMDGANGDSIFDF